MCSSECFVKIECNLNPIITFFCIEIISFHVWHTVVYRWTSNHWLALTSNQPNLTSYLAISKSHELNWQGGDVYVCYCTNLTILSELRVDKQRLAQSLERPCRHSLSPASHNSIGRGPMEVRNKLMVCRLQQQLVCQLEARVWRVQEPRPPPILSSRLSSNKAWRQASHSNSSPKPRLLTSVLPSHTLSVAPSRQRYVGHCVHQRIWFHAQPTSTLFKYTHCHKCVLISQTGQLPKKCKTYGGSGLLERCFGQWAGVRRSKIDRVIENRTYRGPTYRDTPVCAIPFSGSTYWCCHCWCLQFVRHCSFSNSSLQQAPYWVDLLSKFSKAGCHLLCFLRASLCFPLHVSWIEVQSENTLLTWTAHWSQQNASDPIAVAHWANLCACSHWMFF